MGLDCSTTNDCFSILIGITKALEGWDERELKPGQGAQFLVFSVHCTGAVSYLHFKGFKF